MNPMLRLRVGRAELESGVTVVVNRGLGPVAGMCTVEVPANVLPTDGVLRHRFEFRLARFALFNVAGYGFLLFA